MAFGKLSDGTAVGPRQPSLPGALCLLAGWGGVGWGWGKQSNAGGTAAAGRVILADPRHPKGAVRGGGGSLQRRSCLGTVVLEVSISLGSGDKPV